VLCINKDSNLNEGIRVREVRLVSEDESRIISTVEALELAVQQDLDLVMISPTAVPPVCKIMDYSKFLFEKGKKEKEARKNQKIVNLKEIRLSPTIEENDIDTKVKNAIKFLTNGDKLKVSVRFRGRQNNYTDSGKIVLENFLSKLNDLGIVEKSATLEGKNMFMIISPRK
jgi:translation initiation factor IF-3